MDSRFHGNDGRGGGRGFMVRPFDRLRVNGRRERGGESRKRKERGKKVERGIRGSTLRSFDKLRRARLRVNGGGGCGCYLKERG